MSMPPGLPEKGGLADVFSEIFRRLAALERAPKLPHSSIGSGGLRVHSGGGIAIEGGGVITIDGVVQPALEVVVEEDDTAVDTVITGSLVTLGQVVLDVPEWATVFDVVAVGHITVTEVGGAHNCTLTVTIDVGGPEQGTSFTSQTVGAGTVQSIGLQRVSRLTSPGSTVTVRLQAQASTPGPHDANESKLSAFGVARRV